MEHKMNVQPYQLKGLHCSKCLEDFLEDYEDTFKENNISYDRDHDIFLISDETDWHVLDKITSFEKVSFQKVSSHAEEDAHDEHGHHQHVSNQSTTKMWAVFALNIIFAIFEVIFGVLFNSSAVLADAVHDFGDAVSIGVAALLEGISNREPNRRFSFGYNRFSLLGSLITAGVLIIGSIITLIHSVPKLFNPELVNETGIFWVAIVAIIINAIGAWILRDGESANESMLNLHLLEDVLGWVAVLIVSIILQFTDWYILDPILSILIALFIFSRAIPPVKESLIVFLEGVPANLNAEEIKSNILNVENVEEISHFHLWSLDGQHHSMSVTISVDSQKVKDEEKLKRQIRDVVFPKNITHVTIEIVKDIDKI